MKQILAIISALLLVVSAQAGTGISSVQTSATGTTWVDLPSLGTINRLHLYNDTGTSIDVRIGAGGTALTLPNLSYWSFNEIKGSATAFSVRRSDVGGTQVTLKFVYEVP
jgi:hypothetical protein